MILGPMALALSTLACASPPQEAPLVPADTVSREALYKQGITFEAFFESAVARREMWVTNYERGTVPEELLARALAVPGQWRLLVIAIDACSDSANTLPYLVHLVDAVPGLEMRIVDSTVGRVVMEAHPTPDGRPATPTMVLLDERYREVGCFIERPDELQTWALGEGAELGSRAFLDAKFAWYDKDAGAQTMGAIVALMEAAAAGADSC